MLRPRNSMPDPELPPIHTVRGQRVVFDSDLAALYGVLTKRLNEAVRRNADRFPEDFCFQLTSEEHARLKSQIVMSKPQVIGELFIPSNWSQIATSSRKHRGAAYRPWAFTEHGALMSADNRPGSIRPYPSPAGFDAGAMLLAFDHPCFLATTFLAVTASVLCLFILPRRCRCSLPFLQLCT